MDETEGTPMEAPAPDRSRDNADRDQLPDAAREMDRDDLSRLVREANEQGVSYQEMSDRAAAANLDLSKPYFQKMATNAIGTAPTPERLRAIAAGLRKPLPVIQRAAAVQYLDYRATELAGYDEETRIIVAHLAGMKPSDRSRWRAMMEAAGQILDDE